MIGKTIKTDNFSSLVRYLTRHRRGEILAFRNLASATPVEAAGEMEVAAMVNTRSKQRGLHIVISYNKSDAAPTDDEMTADAAAVLKSLGLERNQALIVRHHDREHHHFHVAANRIGADGKAVSDSNSYMKIEAALRKIEGERGLTTTAGRHAQTADDKTFAGPRRSRDPRQHAVPPGVRTALEGARSFDDLNHRLDAEGWRYEIRQKPGKRPGGILQGPDGQKIAAGRVDPQFSYGHLQKRFTADAITNHPTPASASPSTQSPRTARPALDSTALARGLSPGTPRKLKVGKLGAGGALGSGKKKNKNDAAKLREVAGKATKIFTLGM